MSFFRKPTRPYMGFSYHKEEDGRWSITIHLPNGEVMSGGTIDHLPMDTPPLSPEEVDRLKEERINEDFHRR